MSARRLGILLAMTCAFAATSARAEDDCPLGSVEKKESGDTWCEPTVCDTDVQCPTGSICRPVPLCVEIGTLDRRPGDETDAAASTKLLVRQRCGEDKACPPKTTCSEKSRCITRAQADRAGLSAAPGTDAGLAPAAAKKSCGCHAPGTSGGETGGGALALLGALAMIARRRGR
jgi:MYXO-CTERM domain-containing protein